MNDVPRQKLREIITQYGRSICDNPQHCKGLLLDLCGEQKREINILIAVLEEHAVADLLHSSASVPTEILQARLTQRMCDNRSMEKEAARWGVESWALALGLSIQEAVSSEVVSPLSLLTSVQASPPSSLPPPMQRASVSSPLGTILCTYRGHAHLLLAGVTAVAWSPDGTRIVSGGSLGVIWKADTGEALIRTSQKFVSTAAWSPDGKFIAWGVQVEKDQVVQVVDVAANRNVIGIKIPFGEVAEVTWSPDGQRIVIGYSSNVCVLDATNGKTIWVESHSDWRHVNGVTWSPDGKFIASASNNKTVQVWDATNGGKVLTYNGHSKGVNAVAWSPGGQQIASAGDDGTVQVLDALTGKNLLTYSGHSNQVNAVCWSPDGQQLASAGNDATVQVWDAATGKNTYTFAGHSNKVLAVAWSPDGQRIASGGADKTVQVWQAA